MKLLFCVCKYNVIFINNYVVTYHADPRVDKHDYTSHIIKHFIIPLLKYAYIKVIR